ncbi:MAG: DNA-binding protein [Burkholderiaceae bacterium]|nr:DNA-binding protein [Burkholderiaceae bacterium]
MVRLSRRLRAHAAPALIIRRPPSWTFRAGALLVALLAGVAIGAWWGGRTASNSGATASRGSATAELARGLEVAELNRLQAIANAADSQVKMERSAAERLARQARELEIDNARLKSDLTYLESLLPASDGQAGMAVRGFRVEFDSAQSQLHFRALLTQGGRVERDFIGSLQLLVSLQSAGRAVTLTVPDQASSPVLRETFKLSFRRAHRVQAMVPLPAGASVRSVQLRVLEGGAVRAQQTAMP